MRIIQGTSVLECTKDYKLLCSCIIVFKMELPHLGDHCSETSCKQLDFLPMKCDACNSIFCNEHFHYENHNCPSAYKKNVQVPVCPLCNIPIPVSRGQPPDIAVGAHIDSDCQSDPAKSRRKVFTNRCSMKGCRIKEIVPVLCTECSLNYCLKHRHTTDHKCEGKGAALRRNTLNAALTRTNKSSNNSSFAAVQGSLDEDEALARALAMSLEDNKKVANNMTQEELDAELARQLQQQEQQPNRGRNHSRFDRCRLS